MLDEGAAYVWFAQQIMSDKARVARLAGIAWLDDLQPPEPSPTLKEVDDPFSMNRRYKDSWQIARVAVPCQCTGQLLLTATPAIGIHVPDCGGCGSDTGGQSVGPRGT